MVWDSIFARDVGRSEPVEEWGGIAYALSAFEAVRPAGWGVLPIVKVGADLRERAGEFFASLACIESLDGVRTVREPNNRVTLRYEDHARRSETLRGGVPGWEWIELQPLARSCDALYINLIAGWEIDLECAAALRREFQGPLYCDLHSLFLGVGPDGTRVPRSLEKWRSWLPCFDLVQLNEAEFNRLAATRGDPWVLAAEVVGAETKALFVTLADRGAAWVAAPGFDRLSDRHPHASIVGPTAATSGKIAVDSPQTTGDPTGCGDVWGMTCFLALLQGARVADAVRVANRVAARNARVRGASKLAQRLRDGPPIILKPES